MSRIGVIGCGKMGSAIVMGMVQHEYIEPEHITVVDNHIELAERLGTSLNVCVGEDNLEAARGVDMLILAVKPQHIEAVLDEVEPVLAPGALIISIAAGVTLKRLATLVGTSRKLVRVMPNLPAQVHAGMTAITPNELVQDLEVASVLELFECMGDAVLVPETYMDAVTALSGSGPAYVCLFIEAMADAAVLLGLPRDLAYRLAEQTVAGSAAYLQKTATHPAVLKDEVASPGGTTIAALAELEARGLRSAVIEAMRVCAQRNQEL
ncbi:pyrroline-5-carboxylate reductase [Collinsella sp. zg1085]|uniref:pyrroline-5-carboxylate reductase n=1 Tax=Collinsella sp. zg1085 TaxID=2844380 RepID=UPI001C0DDF35|nr:pyrroline-5-carboxylate reductase [Collinsella sp. zg1085]QWT18142.1 pyrroline-5-carboxylate reductase [Collinsella sp. zg1085]